MAEHINLYARRTHRYRDGWRHLDKHEFIGVVRATDAVLVEEAKDYDEAGVYKRLVTIPRGMDPKAAHRALYDAFSGGGCQHEYDCCGCLHWSSTIKQTKRREFSVRTSYYRNY